MDAFAPRQLRDKYVLIGATAASLGDRLASPFIHASGPGPNQHGSLMPGVEILANTLNTILRSRFYSQTPDWLAFLCGALVAAITLFGLTMAQGRYEAIKQIVALVAILAAVLLASYFSLTRLLVFPPLTLSLVSLTSAGLLGQLRRSLIASGQIDRSIEEVKRAESALTAMNLGSAAESIARLADADGVAIYVSQEGLAPAIGDGPRHDNSSAAVTTLSRCRLKVRARGCCRFRSRDRMARSRS